MQEELQYIMIAVQDMWVTIIYYAKIVWTRAARFVQ